eukprot:19071-Heterococcus_DN1.PRE.2
MQPHCYLCDIRENAYAMTSFNAEYKLDSGSDRCNMCIWQQVVVCNYCYCCCVLLLQLRTKHCTNQQLMRSAQKQLHKTTKCKRCDHSMLTIHRRVTSCLHISSTTLVTLLHQYTRMRAYSKQVYTSIHITSNIRKVAITIESFLLGREHRNREGHKGPIIHKRSRLQTMLLWQTRCAELVVYESSTRTICRVAKHQKEALRPGHRLLYH